MSDLTRSDIILEELKPSAFRVLVVTREGLGYKLNACIGYLALRYNEWAFGVGDPNQLPDHTMSVNYFRLEGPGNVPSFCVWGFDTQIAALDELLAWHNGHFKPGRDLQIEHPTITFDEPIPESALSEETAWSRRPVRWINLLEPDDPVCS